MKTKQISLTGIAFLEPTVNEKTEQNVCIRNVLLPNGCVAPKSGVSLYYGSKMSTTKSLSLAFTHSAAQTKKLITIPLELTLPTQEGATSSRSDLSTIGFLNIERIDKELTTVIHGHYLMYRESIQQSCPDISSLRTLLMAISKDLEFLDYLHSRDEFKTISIIAFPVVEDNGEKSTRAVLFDTQNIDASAIRHPSYKNTKFYFE